MLNFMMVFFTTVFETIFCCCCPLVLIQFNIASPLNVGFTVRHFFFLVFLDFSKYTDEMIPKWSKFHTHNYSVLLQFCRVFFSHLSHPNTMHNVFFYIQFPEIQDVFHWKPEQHCILDIIVSVYIMVFDTWIDRSLYF